MMLRPIGTGSIIIIIINCSPNVFVGELMTDYDNVRCQSHLLLYHWRPCSLHCNDGSKCKLIISLILLTMRYDNNILEPTKVQNTHRDQVSWWMYVRNKILRTKREHNEKLTPRKWVESSLMDNKWLTHEIHYDFFSIFFSRSITPPLCHSLFVSFFMLILISSGFWSKWFLFTFGSSLSMCHIKIAQFLLVAIFLHLLLFVLS